MFVTDFETKFFDVDHQAWFSESEEFKGSEDDFSYWFPCNYWVEAFPTGINQGEFRLMEGEDFVVKVPLSDSMRTELQKKIAMATGSELPSLDKRFDFYLHLMRMYVLDRYSVSVEDTKAVETQVREDEEELHFTDDGPIDDDKVGDGEVNAM